MRTGTNRNYGNRTSGSCRYNAKLSDKCVRAIRHNREGLSVKDQAERYGVSCSNIYQVLQRTTYREVVAD